jgi:hypothetical protein
MTLSYDSQRRPMVLRRLSGEDAEAARFEASDQGRECGQDQVADSIEAAPLIMSAKLSGAKSMRMPGLPSISGRRGF